ncbi:MAG: DUF4406 domain-containing protein [Bacilli bacterium]|nr:DUF4406 domain-containing protein [Bacilli bacterium]
MRVYISGAITSLAERGEDYVKPFRDCAYELKKRGYSPVNPLDYQKEIYAKYNGKPTHADFMNELLKVLLDCDGICMLDNWTESVGAECEKYVAEETGKIFVEFR